MPRILCVDFDGVLHSYTSGWNGATQIDDPPVKGALKWLVDIIAGAQFAVAIYSARSKEEGGPEAMQDWLMKWLTDPTHDGMGLNRQSAVAVVGEIDFPVTKPPAYLTIDDRAICFRGTFPSVQEMDHFKPWNK